MNATKELETAVRALRAIREQKQQEINDIDKSIEDFLRVLAKLPEGMARAQELGDITDRYATLSIPKAAEAFLREVKQGPATGKEIADALLRGGIKTTAKAFENVVYSRLQESTSPKFRRTPDGRAWWFAGVPFGTDAFGLEDSTPAGALATAKRR